jgi:hypothetical protein
MRIMNYRAIINNYDNRGYGNICINNVVELDEQRKVKNLYRNHTWLMYRENKPIRNIPLKTVIEFEATPYRYANGTKKGLKNIRNVKKVNVKHKILRC